MQFFLCVMMLMAFSVQKASAQTNWKNEWNWVNFNPADGTLDLYIRIFQYWGGNNAGHCGFCTSSGNLTVDVAGYKLEIDGEDNFTDDSKGYVKSKPELPDECVEWVGKILDDAYYVLVKIPLKQAHLNSSVTVNYRGKWWREGIAGDNTVKDDKTVSTAYTCAETKITQGYYGVQGNTPGYFLNIEKGNSSGNNSVDNYGHYILCNSTGKAIDGVAKIKASNTVGTFFVPTNELSLDNSLDYIVKQVFTPDFNKGVTFTTEGPSHTRPAYPQVKEISANYNQVTRKIKVNWNLSAAPTQNYIQDQMELTIKSTEVGTSTEKTTTQNISYLAGRTAYSYEFDVPLGKSYNYEFTIRRLHTKNYAAWNNMYSKRTSLSASAKHSNVTAGSVHAVLDEEAKTATITWQTEGDTWSSGTKAVLTRLNVTTNTTDNIELSKEEFLSGKYVDDMIMVCNEYRYRLTVKPAEAYGTLPTVAAPESIMPTSIGNLVAFTAGKGYYSDRVELAWSSKGNFERFVINRKEHGAPDTDYKQIAVTEGNEAQNDYYYNDVNAVPGVVYDYQIKGQVMCSGNLLESDEVLTDVGFRTPTGDIYGRVTFESGQAVSGAKVSAELRMVRAFRASRTCSQVRLILPSTTTSF